MGLGKTRTYLNVLLENEAAGKRTLIATNRCSLVKDVLANAKKMGSSLVSYDTRTGELRHNMSLIVQQESLHKLEKPRPYDLVIIDEMESFLNQAASTETHKTSLTENIVTLIGVLQSAEQVIICDAVTTKKTMRFLSSIGINDVDVIECKGWSKSRREVHFVQAGKSPTDVASRMASFIARKVVDGENVFVYYPYKTTIVDKLGVKRFGIESFAKEIQRLTGLSDDKILAYHGDMSDKVCNETLADVNASWSSKRVVLTTSKITVGVSFELPHFQSVVVARTPNCLPRNLI
jgi:hypothetical protein